MQPMQSNILREWLTRHSQVALHSLGRISKNPMSAWMTITVIAIALALPAGLYLITQNLQRLGANWEGDATVSLYLNEATDNSTEKLADLLKTWEEISTTNVITAEQGLTDFRQNAGLSRALDNLSNNPLPDVIVVKPANPHDETALTALIVKLENLPGVDIAQMDLDWVKRFNALLNLTQTAIALISGLLGLGVLLVIGNTIRLEIQNRKDEIEITQLVGGTNGFIRRPFLYSGFWYGLSGGILAWVFVSILYWVLKKPVEQLSGLYHSQYGLTGLGLFDSFLILALGSFLGLCGAWLAASYHLYRGNNLSRYY